MVEAVLISAALGGGAAIVAGTSILTGILVGGALGAAAQLLAPKPPNLDFDTSDVGVDTRSTAVSAIEDARWVMGTARTGGSIKFYEETNDGRDVWLAVAISEGECEQILKIWIDGEEVAFNRSGDRLQMSGDYAGKATIYEYFAADGSQGGAIRAACEEFTSDYRFLGLSWVAIHLHQPEYDDADGRFWSRRPEIQYLVKGIKITWPGQTTPIWTENAAALRYFLETERGGLDPSAVDLASFTAAYRVCQAEVTIASNQAGDYENQGIRYSVNGVLTAGMALDNVRREFDYCWQGWAVESGGIQYFQPGADRAPVGTIEESDTLAVGEVRPAPSLQERFNAVSMRLIQCKDTDWQPFDVPESLDAMTLARDDNFYLPQDAGQRVFMTGALDALRVQSILLRRMRPSMTIAIEIMPGENLNRYAWRPGDRVLVNNSEYGFSNFMCEINSITIKENSGSVALTLNEVQTGAYADELDLPPLKRRDLAIAGARSIPAVVNLQASESAVVQADGTILIFLVATYDRVGYRVEVEIRQLNQTALIDTLSTTSGMARWPGAIAKTTYEIRARHVAYDGHAGPFTAWISRTIGGDLTPPGKATGLQFEGLPGGYRINWDWPTAPDYSYSIVYQNLSSNSFADANMIARTSNPEFTQLGFSEVRQVSLWVRHVDRSANQGPLSDVVTGSTALPEQLRGAAIFRLILTAEQSRAWNDNAYAPGAQIDDENFIALLATAVDDSQPKDNDWVQIQFTRFTTGDPPMEVDLNAVWVNYSGTAWIRATDDLIAAPEVRTIAISAIRGNFDDIEVQGRLAADHVSADVRNSVVLYDQPIQVVTNDARSIVLLDDAEELNSLLLGGYVFDMDDNRYYLTGYIEVVALGSSTSFLAPNKNFISILNVNDLTALSRFQGWFADSRTVTVRVVIVRGNNKANSGSVSATWYRDGATTLTVAAPSVSNQSPRRNASVTFTASLPGGTATGPITAQWYARSGTGWAPIRNQTGTSYTITDPGGTFTTRVAVTQDDLTVYSPEVSATWQRSGAARRLFAGSPAVSDAAPTVGDTVTFTAPAPGGTATGDISYQWQELIGSTWRDIQDATSETYQRTVSEISGREMRFATANEFNITSIIGFKNPQSEQESA